MARALAQAGAMRRVLLAVVASATLAGCVTIDATLAPDGSATFRMTYRTGPDATEFMEKRRVASEDVIVDRVKIEEDGLTTVDAHVDDVTRLSTSAAFRDVTVTRARDGAEEIVTIVAVNRAPARRKDDRRAGPRLTITLPGEVVRANEHAVVTG